MAEQQQGLFEVPNLDGLSVDPEDLMEAAAVYAMLSLYSLYTGRAMRCRMTGRIKEALDLEKQAEGVYKDLPGWAKW